MGFVRVPDANRIMLGKGTVVSVIPNKYNFFVGGGRRQANP